MSHERGHVDSLEERGVDFRPEEEALRAQPPQALPEVDQFRTWIRLIIRGLVNSISMSEKLEPEVNLHVLDALCCDAMEGKAAEESVSLGPRRRSAPRGSGQRRLKTG